MIDGLFSALGIYHGVTAHSAAMNMAIDEALLQSAEIASVRFYRWHSPALSFGYFGRFADVAGYQTERDLVRRWTGGGIVFHGDDLTYSIVIPSGDRLFGESSMSIYEKIHHALADALASAGASVELASAAGSLNSSDFIIDRSYNCFANPVRADVMIDSRKIAGAAQRRTRRGLLQQGSIQGIDLKQNFTESFAGALSANCVERRIDEEILSRARVLVSQKYGTCGWLRKH